MVLLTGAFAGPEGGRDGRRTAFVLSGASHGQEVSVPVRHGGQASRPGRLAWPNALRFPGRLHRPARVQGPARAPYCADVPAAQ